MYTVTSVNKRKSSVESCGKISCSQGSRDVVIMVLVIHQTRVIEWTCVFYINYVVRFKTKTFRHIIIVCVRKTSVTVFFVITYI